MNVPQRSVSWGLFFDWVLPISLRPKHCRVWTLPTWHRIGSASEGSLPCGYSSPGARPVNRHSEGDPLLKAGTDPYDRPMVSGTRTASFFWSRQAGRHPQSQDPWSDVRGENLPFSLHSFFNGAGTETSCAYIGFLGAFFGHDTQSLKIWHDQPFCPVIRMTHIIADYPFFAANNTTCHSLFILLHSLHS